MLFPQASKALRDNLSEKVLFSSKPFDMVLKYSVLE